VARLSAGETEAWGSMPPRRTTAHHGALGRSAPVVFGCAAVHRLHGEGVAEPKGHTRAGAQVCEPIPGAKARDGDNTRVPRGRHGLEQRLWAGLHGTMEPHFAVLVEETGLPHAGVQGDATIKLMLLGVQSHEVSSSCA
jgi:hypothetical protein